MTNIKKRITEILTAFIDKRGNFVLTSGNNSFYGQVFQKTLEKLKSGEIKNAPIKKKNSSGKWRIIGWLNRIDSGAVVVNTSGCVAFVPLERFLTLLNRRVHNILFFLKTRGGERGG